MTLLLAYGAVRGDSSLPAAAAYRPSAEAGQLLHELCSREGPRCPYFDAPSLLETGDRNDVSTTTAKDAEIDRVALPKVACTIRPLLQSSFTFVHDSPRIRVSLYLSLSLSMYMYNLLGTYEKGNRGKCTA